MHVSGSPVSIISCYNNDIILRRNYTPVMNWKGCYRQIFLPSTSASAAMIILLYFRLSRLKSLPYPWEKPQPSALTMALISSLERTRSVVCFSTFRIFGLSDISIGPDYLLLSAICQSLRRALRFGLCTNNNPTSRLTGNSRYKRAFAHFSRD